MRRRKKKIHDDESTMKILFLCLVLSFGWWWDLMKWCVVGSLKVDWDNDDRLILRSFGSFGKCLLKTCPAQVLGYWGVRRKCVEGKRKSTTTSRRWRSSFLPNNGTAGDLLECNCRCYLYDANDREMMGPGGHSPRSRTFHYGRTTDRHLRRIVSHGIVMMM